MSGDLEDFLRRAAQRRQAKAAQERAASARPSESRSGSRTRPQYSDRRTERIVSADEADEILVAEVVDDEAHNSIADRMRRLEAAKQAAAEAESSLGRLRRADQKPQAKAPAAAGPLLSGDPVQNLIKLLRQPAGIQQAILLREILDRPTHRW